MNRPPLRKQLVTYEITGDTFVTQLQNLKKRLRTIRRGKMYGEIVGVVVKPTDTQVVFWVWLREGRLKVSLPLVDIEKMTGFIESLHFGSSELKKTGMTFIPGDMIICKACFAPTVFARMDSDHEWRKCLRCGGIMVLEE